MHSYVSAEMVKEPYSYNAGFIKFYYDVALHKVHIP